MSLSEDDVRRIAVEVCDEMERRVSPRPLPPPEVTEAALVLVRAARAGRPRNPPPGWGLRTARYIAADHPEIDPNVIVSAWNAVLAEEMRAESDKLPGSPPSGA